MQIKNANSRIDANWTERSPISRCIREHISGFQVTFKVYTIWTSLYTVFPKIEADPIKRINIFCTAIDNSEQFMILNSGE